ncbi:MAG: hypothetical protein ACT4RN_08140 [Pseudonocardia sp.]
MLVYRAMWSHDDGGVVAAAVASFRRATGDAGEVERAGPSRADGIADVVRAVATRNGADGSCQVTTLRAWTGEACARTGDGARARVWVDVDARGNGVGGDLLAAPPLVLDLLEGDAGAARGGVLLAAPGRPQRCSGAEGAEVLADLVTGLRRDVAVVVLGPPQDPADAPAVERFAQAAASAVAGSAVVCVLDAVAAAALVGVVGAEHAVEAGACRVYLPGMDPALDEAHRHVTWYPDPDAEAVDQLVRAVGPTALTLRPDESYDAARAVLRRQRIERLPGEAGEWLAAVEEDNDRLADALDVATRELEAQRRRTAELERERATLVGERVELRGRIAWVRTMLR